jgi:hypothetical protein
LAETWTAPGIDLGPSCRSSFSIGGPGSIVHADQSRNGEQGLAGDRTAQHGGVLIVERALPVPETLRDIAVEPTRRASIGREAAVSIVVIRPGEMDAVVMKEDPASVCLVVFAKEVLGAGDSDLDTATH